MIPISRTPLSRTLARTAGLALLPALALAGAAPAAAHDELTAAVPAAGSTVAQAPEEVTLTFSGELIDGQGIQNLVQVRDAAGNQWQAEEGTVDGATFSAPLCPGLPDGEYDVAYRVVYSDGHTEERSHAFTVDDPSAPAAGAVPKDCGVPAAGVSPADQTTAAATPSADPAASEGASGSRAGTASPTSVAPAAPASAIPGAASAASQQAEETPAEETPAWVWPAGIAGVLVLLAAGVAMTRRAKALGHLDDDRR